MERKQKGLEVTNFDRIECTGWREGRGAGYPVAQDSIGVARAAAGKPVCRSYLPGQPARPTSQPAAASSQKHGRQPQRLSMTQHQTEPRDQPLEI